MRLLLFLSALVGIAVGSATAALATCQSGEKVIRFGIAKADDDTKTSRLAKEVQTQFQRALNGHICVDIVQDAEISVSGTEFEALREGRADIVAASFESLAARSARFKIFGLPFAFPDRFVLDRYIAASSPDDWNKGLGSFGLKGFGLALYGFEQLGAKKEVFRPTDAIGLKFRQKDQHPSRETLQLMKSSGQRVPDKDVAAAVKDGRVEAQFTDWSSLRSSGSGANHAVLVETNFAMPGVQVVATTLWFEKLDQKSRSDISKAIAGGVTQFNRRELQRNLEAKRALLQSGKTIYVLTRGQRERWKEIFAPLWSEFQESSVGREQLKLIDDAGL